MADTGRTITLEQMEVFVDDLVGRTTTVRGMVASETIIILRAADYDSLLALQNYFKRFAVPYAGDIRKLVAGKMRLRS